MGQALSIDIVSGIIMAVIGVVTIFQTTQLARLYRRPSVPDEERCRSQGTEWVALAIEPETGDLWCPTYHPTLSVAISSCGSTVSTGSSTEDEEENIESLGVADLLRGIGTSFEEGNTENAAQAFGELAEMVIDSRCLSRDFGQASTGQGDREIVNKPTQAAASEALRMAFL